MERSKRTLVLAVAGAGALGVVVGISAVARTLVFRVKDASQPVTVEVSR